MIIRLKVGLRSTMYLIFDHIKKSGLFDTSKIIHDSYEESEAEWRKQYLAQLEKEKKDADSKHED